MPIQSKPRMPEQRPLDIASELVVREGHLLDSHDWDAWLGLYREDAVFWVPAWRNEAETVQDPDTEVSLIYHDSRVGLEERVLRLRTGKSVTVMPLPRTAHFASNFMLAAAPTPERIDLRSSWQVMLYLPRTAAQYLLAGYYEHQLSRSGGVWQISRKKITLINDRVPTLVDFYCL